jgi:hypothetical protein
VIVAANPSALQISGAKISYRWGPKHLSPDLLHDAGYVDDEELVEILSEFVIWAGRFPAPQREPIAEQAWDTERENKYRAIRDSLRLKLKMSIRSDQRRSLEAELRESLTVSTHDGVLLFQSQSEEPVPTLGVSCECGSFFDLSPRYPAAICFCGKLYRSLLKHNRYGGTRLDLDVYPDAP